MRLRFINEFSQAQGGKGATNESESEIAKFVLAAEKASTVQQKPFPRLSLSLSVARSQHILMAAAAAAAALFALNT